MMSVRPAPGSTFIGEDSADDEAAAMEEDAMGEGNDVGETC